MFFSYFRKYVHDILFSIPIEHWVVMFFLAFVLTTFAFFRRYKLWYGVIAFGITVFVSLFLLDTTVVLRYLDILPHGSGLGYKVGLDRLIHGTIYSRTEVISNIAVFVPFGFFLTVFLISTRHFDSWHQFGFVTLAALGFSLCIECLQLFLDVGYFEVTDLVMNTVGALLGLILVVLLRLIFWKKDCR